VWTDVDPRKHEGFVARHPSRTALFASAADLPFRDGAMDTAIFISLAHHLTDPQLDQALDEVARVVRSRILFLDPVMDGASVFGRFLWACDRGSFPRTSVDLRARLERHFEPEQVATPRLYHRYLLFAGRRRGRH
jgi:SAM-dependent methyltransferase